MTTPNAPSLFVPKHLLGHQSSSKLGPFLLPAKGEHSYSSEREKKEVQVWGFCFMKTCLLSFQNPNTQ